MVLFFFFFQAEDGIRDAQESRGLGDVYKRQLHVGPQHANVHSCVFRLGNVDTDAMADYIRRYPDCLLYTSDAADDLLCVDLGGRRIIKKKRYTYLESIQTTKSHIHIHVMRDHQSIPD